TNSLSYFFSSFFFTAPTTTDIYTLSLHDALPIWMVPDVVAFFPSLTVVDVTLIPSMVISPCSSEISDICARADDVIVLSAMSTRSEEHTSELQSRSDLVCRLLLEKKKKKK